MRSSKKYYNKFRSSAIEYLGGVCVVCGATDKLEFDHIDPETKLFSISKVWEYPIDKLKSELNKCQLLCHEHHVDKHRTKEHGTATLYKHGCRCDACRIKHNIYIKEYKRKRAREELMVDLRDCES